MGLGEVLRMISDLLLVLVICDHLVINCLCYVGIQTAWADLPMVCRCFINMSF
jgi:hypothetical protein